MTSILIALGDALVVTFICMAIFLQTATCNFFAYSFSESEAPKQVVTSNLHETTLCCFEKISFKVYGRKQKGKRDILLFPVVLVQSKLDISTKNPAIMLE